MIQHYKPEIHAILSQMWTDRCMKIIQAFMFSDSFNQLK